MLPQRSLPDADPVLVGKPVGRRDARQEHRGEQPSIGDAHLIDPPTHAAGLQSKGFDQYIKQYTDSTGATQGWDGKSQIYGRSAIKPTAWYIQYGGYAIDANGVTPITGKVLYNAYNIIIGVVLGLFFAIVLGVVAFLVIKKRRAASSAAAHVQSKV